MNIVEFPGLGGLKLDVNPVAFQIGSVLIYWYGIIIAIGFLTAVLLAMRASKNFGLTSDNVIDLVLIGAPISIVFARIYYVVFSWEEYNWDFLKMVNVREGGIAIYGALIGALLGGIIYAKWKKINIFELFDFVMPYFALAQAIGRWGNFVNQEAFGVNTTLPWGMKSQATMNYLSANADKLSQKGILVDPSMPVHPTFLYESIWNLLVFVGLIWFRKKKKLSGEVFFLYMILYGFGRSIIEGFRTDSLMLGSFRISQVVAIVFVVAFIAIFMILRIHTAEKEANEPVVLGQSVYGDLLTRLKSEAEIAEKSEIEIAEEVVGKEVADQEVATNQEIESTEQRVQEENFENKNDLNLEISSEQLEEIEIEQKEQ